MAVWFWGEDGELQIGRVDAVSQGHGLHLSAAYRPRMFRFWPMPKSSGPTVSFSSSAESSSTMDGKLAGDGGWGRVYGEKT
jgi:hypothetical protein